MATIRALRQRARFNGFQGIGAMEDKVLSEQEASTARRGRGASGGAAARRAARSGGGPGTQLTYIKREIPVYEVLNEEGISLIAGRR